MKYRALIGLLVVQALLLPRFACAAEGEFFYFSNSFLKDGMVLALDANNRLMMQPRDDSSLRQRWELIASSNGAVRIHNAGLGRGFSVDSDTQKPFMGKTGNYSGQYWHLTPDGQWLRLSNTYQGFNKVLDVYNQSGNYLFFGSKANRTSGSYWKKISAPAITSQSLTTTTTTLTLKESTLGGVSDSGLTAAQTLSLDFERAAGDQIVVSGCVDDKSTSVNECLTNTSAMKLKEIAAPCFGRRSLIMRNQSDPDRYTSPQVLKNNDCQGSHPLSSYQSEFDRVENFFVGSEQRFIELLKSAPELVVDFESDQVKETLAKTGGKVPYTMVEAYVFGDLMNELANPDTRTPESKAALRWLAKGSEAISLRTWDNARLMYWKWRGDPCAFKLPDDFPQSFKDDFKNRNKERALYTGCGFKQNSIVSTAQSVYSITQVTQGNPDVEEFIKWGGYMTTKDVLLERQDSFNDMALSLTDISVVSAASVATAGGIAAFIAAAVTTTTVTYAGGTVASLAVISAIMPFSGGMVAAASAGGAGLTGAVIGVSALAGPLVIVVLAIVGITATITITAVDADFHKTMQDANPPWDSNFVIERKIESMQSGLAKGEGGDLLFAFSDILRTNNASRFLPFTIKAPAKTAAVKTGTSAWVLGNASKSGNYEIFERANGAWKKVSGLGTQLTVDAAGEPWILNKSGAIWQRKGGQFIQIQGGARDIGAGGGKVWVVGMEAMAGGYKVYEYLGNNAWKTHAFAAVRIDVDDQGNPWVVNSGGDIFHYKNGRLQHIPGKAWDIGAGGGQVWVIGRGPIGGGYEIFRKRADNSWEKVPGGATKIAVNAAGEPWVINSSGTIFQFKNNAWKVLDGKGTDIGVM